MYKSNTGLVFLLILANILWGGAFIANIIALRSLSLYHILFSRVVLATICYLFLWRYFWPPKQYRKGDWKRLLALTLCEPCLLFFFETLGLNYTTASQAGIIAACAPIVAAAGAFIVYRESVGKRCLLGMVAALCGVAIVLFSGDGAKTASNPLLGNVFIFCAVCSTTAYALLVKDLSSRYSALFIAAIQCFGSSIVFLPMAVATSLPANLPSTAWLALVYLGLGVTFFSYLILNFAFSRIKAGHVMLFSNLIPIAALGLAFFILDERMNMLQYAGAAVVVGGMVLAGKPDEA